MIRLGCALLFILTLVGFWAAVKFLTWWQFALLIVALMLLVKFGGRWLVSSVIYKIFLAPFKLKGAVLKNATIAVHSLVAAETPPMQPALADQRSAEEKAEDEEEDVDEEE